MVPWGRVLTILTIIGIIIGAIYSMPSIIWIVQPQKTNLVCPLTLINQSSTGIQLKNLGRVSATLTVSFEGKNISFINDFGNYVSKASVPYIIEAGQALSYNFIPIFDFSPFGSNFTRELVITTDCTFFFETSCINANMSKCCYYKTSTSNALELVNETDCE